MQMNKIIDDAIIDAHEIVNKEYPLLGTVEGIFQLGIFMKLLAALRIILGHSDCLGTFRDYTHFSGIDDVANDIGEVNDFCEREIFCLTKSKIDIDSYTTANKKNERPSLKYQEKAAELKEKVRVEVR